ncbi:MAG: DUF308 domain-containing protein [Lachnospiraceae bacterium]|nr:DUF308 domain-containing protein [Lachnospiraceae bacterium]
MKELLKNYIVDAVLLIALGIVFLIKPGSSLVFLCHVIAVVLLVMGGVKIAGTLVAHEQQPTQDDGRGFRLFTSVIQIVFGLLLLIKADLFIGIFPFLAGAVIAYGAVVSLVRTFKERGTASPNVTKITMVLAIVTLIIAIVVIIHPVFISKFIVQIIGVALLVEGVTIIAAHGANSQA